MKILLIAIMIFVASIANAADKWDKIDYSLLAASTLVLAADWQQTRTIANNPNEWEERVTPFLNRHPSTKSVDLYFAGALLTEILVAELLPSKWRKVWLSGWLVVEGGTVAYNYSIGIRF